MSAPALRPAVVLSVWTVLVWTTRIRNVWTDDDLTTSGQLWRTALALGFTAFAAVTLSAWYLARRRPPAPRWSRSLVRAFAVWTTGVWLVRGTQIVLGDHDAAFVVVHTVLAVVSVAAAAWADRAASRSASADPSASGSPHLTSR